MNRIEFLSGHRWAREICFNSAAELRLPDGHERLLTTLRRGLEQKPEGYAAGVLEIINIVEDAKIVRAIGVQV